MDADAKAAVERERAAQRAAIADASPWLTVTMAAVYLRRGRRFVLREIRAERLRAARIGGRGEILTRREWCDAWVENQAAPVAIARRRA